MNLTPEELKYLYKVLQTTSNYTKARAEQIDLPSVDHKKLEQKIKDEIYKLHS